MSKAIACTQFPRAYLDRLIGKRHADEADEIVDTLADGLSDEFGVHAYYDDGIIVCGTTAERKKVRNAIKEKIKRVKGGKIVLGAGRSYPYEGRQY